MENIIIAVISGIVAIVVATIGVSRKNFKLTRDSQVIESVDHDKLIQTLNNTVEAQTKQIDILRGIVDEQRIQLEDKEKEIKELTVRVSNLERLTIEQALVIRELEKARGTRRARHEGGENTEV